MHACLLAQLCPILWDPLDCSPPGSSIHGISQASILESVAIPFSMGASWSRFGTWVSYTAGKFLIVWATWEALVVYPWMCECVLSCFSRVWLFVTLWTVAHQAPLSMGFSRQEYWSGLPCPPPGDVPNPGIELTSPALQADSLRLSHQGSVNKNKTRSWLWLRSWTPYCQIQT